MKNLILSVFTLLSVSIYSQNIKTKKDKILFDNKEIAKFEEKKRLYTISDLNGNVIVKIKPNIHVINENSRKVYYEVFSADESKSVSLYNKSEKSPLSLEKKFLIDFTLGEYKLFTANGMDASVVTAMLDTNLNVKEELKNGTADANKEKERLITLFKNTRLDFDKDGNILKDRKVIGSFKRKTDDNGVNYLYEIYNIDHNLNHNIVGVWHSLKSNVNFAGKTYPTVNDQLLFNNDKVYEIAGSNSSKNMSLSMDNLAIMITAYAFENGLIK